MIIYTTNSHCVLARLAALILLLAPACAMAEENQPPINTVMDLRYEPIQLQTLPKGLSPEKITLGERLFHDKQLSQDNDISCASCHNLKHNGANHLAHSLGRNQTRLDINTPTVFNSSFNHYQFWDGRARSLEQQVDFVVANKKEFATTWHEITHKLKQDKAYVNSFDKIYAEGISVDNIRDAIATFERSLVTINSPFDRYLSGDGNAINEIEKKGYQLFKSYGCAACHQGSNVGGNLFMKFGVFGDYFAERGGITTADFGRFNVTGKQRDKYTFRVPSLRLVAITPPYFHDGTVETLAQAVSIMARHQLGRKISDEDVQCIVAFLKTLTGEYLGQPLSATNQVSESVNPR